MKNHLFIFLFIFQATVNAQSIIPLSGFQNILSFYNPAAAGINEATEINLIQKTQWSGFPEAPKFYAFCINTPFNYQRFGAGLNFYKQSVGIQKFLSISGLFSYKVNFAKGHLSIGTKIGMVQWNEDFNTLSIKDPSETITGNKKTVPDIGAGFLYKDKKYKAGFSVNYSPGIYTGNNHLNKSYYTLFGEVKQKIKNRLSTYPALMLTYTEKISPIVSISIPIEYNNFLWTGISFRSSSTLSFMGGINLHKILQSNYDNITLFYYFDYYANKTNLKPGNSHEIILSFVPGRNSSIETIKRKRATVSPLFFD